MFTTPPALRALAWPRLADDARRTTRSLSTPGDTAGTTCTRSSLSSTVPCGGGSGSHARTCCRTTGRCVGRRRPALAGRCCVPTCRRGHRTRSSTYRLRSPRLAPQTKHPRQGAYRAPAWGGDGGWDKKFSGERAVPLLHALHFRITPKGHSTATNDTQTLISLTLISLTLTLTRKRSTSLRMTCQRYAQLKFATYCHSLNQSTPLHSSSTIGHCSVPISYTCITTRRATRLVANAVFTGGRAKVTAHSK